MFFAIQIISELLVRNRNPGLIKSVTRYFLSFLHRDGDVGT